MTGIAESILALDATAQVSIHAEDVNKITWHDGNPNNITIQQITDKQAVLVAQAATDATAKGVDKASAKSKLAGLGLSEDEISAAFGI